mgnify:CR=1 FL=1
MQKKSNDHRYVIKAIPIETGNSVELARPMQTHPLSYQELDLDPEYTNYADGRFTLEKLSNASPDEMYCHFKWCHSAFGRGSLRTLVVQYSR